MHDNELLLPRGAEGSSEFEGSGLFNLITKIHMEKITFHWSAVKTGHGIP